MQLTTKAYRPNWLAFAEHGLILLPHAASLGAASNHWQQSLSTTTSYDMLRWNCAVETMYLSVWPGLNLGLAPAALAELASTSTTYAKSLYFALASKDFLTTDTAANGKGRPCMHGIHGADLLAMWLKPSSLVLRPLLCAATAS